MDPSVILALIAELYQRVAELSRENAVLRTQLAELSPENAAADAAVDGTEHADAET